MWHIDRLSSRGCRLLQDLNHKIIGFEIYEEFQNIRTTKLICKHTGFIWTRQKQFASVRVAVEKILVNQQRYIDTYWWLGLMLFGSTKLLHSLHHLKSNWWTSFLCFLHQIQIIKTLLPINHDDTDLQFVTKRYLSDL